MIDFFLLSWQMIRATLERVTQITVEFVFNAIIGRLVLYAELFP